MIKEDLMRIAESLIEHSDGHLRMAFNEDDATTAKVADAAHFLKLDEHRIGRDIELYGFLGRIAGDAMAITDFLEGAILPLQCCPASFQIGLRELYNLQGVFGERREEWAELLTSLGLEQS